MQKWGQMFGDNPPQSLDELLEQMQQQMSQMQSLMDSLSDGARRELEDALQSAMDPRLSDEMSEFASLMQSLLPPGDLSREYPFLGGRQYDSGAGDGRDCARCSRWISWNSPCSRRCAPATWDDVDPDQLAELLGEEARRAWEELDRLRQLLKDAGYVTGDDELKLTARGIRRIGQKGHARSLPAPQERPNRQP